MRPIDSITLSCMSRKPVLESANWDEFIGLPQSRSGYKQSSWWADFLTCVGWEDFGLVFSDDEGIVGGARVLSIPFTDDKNYFYVPHGPVLPENPEDAKQVFELFLQGIEQRRRNEEKLISHLRLEPRWEELPGFIQGFYEPDAWDEPRNTLCVDLTADDEALLAQMKSKGRYNVRLARRKGVKVVEDMSAKGVADFFDLYSSTLKRHGRNFYPRDYIEELTETLAELDLGSIFFAEYEGERLATALVIYFGDTATYKYGGSSLAHRNVMAPYLLHYEIMLRARQLGHKWYDFYGVAPPDESEDAWEGFSAFKRKFGGQEFCFVPTMDYIYDEAAYDEYEELDED